MGGFMPKSVIDSLKKQKEVLAGIGGEVDIIQKPKPVIPPITPTIPKATGLPEAAKPKGTFSVIEESKRKIEEMRKKGWIK